MPVNDAVRDLVAGVDSSTQSTKVELREIDGGALVATGRAPHPATTPPRSEQDPEAWWTALIAAFGDEAVASHLGRVAAISVAGQQHGLVVMDESDAVIRPAKLWNDTESAPEAAALVARLGAEEWAARCGSVPVASFTITKLAWLVDHEPDEVDRIAKIHLPHDHLTWRLTGCHVTDRGDASGTGWWDPGTGEYRPDLLAFVAPDRSGTDGESWLARLPAVLGHAQIAGEVTAAAAAATGLPVGTPVGPGTGDNMAAALGLGLRPGDVALSLGTSGVVSVRSPVATADAAGAVAGFADATGEFLPLVCTLNATKVTDTVGRWLGLGREALADAALSAVPSGDAAVLVAYLDGERTPDLPDASGWWSGLRTHTTREDLARSAHEGVVCGLLAGVDALTAVGAPTDGRLHLIGGGSRGAAWRRIVADLRGAPITVPDADETVATGACVQAAMVLGDQPAEVARRWNLGAGTSIEPDLEYPREERLAAHRAAARVVAAAERPLRG